MSQSEVIPPSLPRRKRFPWLIYWIVLALIILVALAPVGSVHPCIINGKDYGHMLYTLGVLGWLMLVTLPGGLIVGAIWLGVLICHRARWKKAALAG